MTTQQIFFAVFAALVLLFAAATWLGHWLDEQPESGVIRAGWVRQLNSRIRAGWLIVLLFAAGFALGTMALVIIFAFASFFALREFVALTPIKASDNWALIIAFYVVIPLQYVLVASGWYAMYAILIPVYLFLLLPVVMAWRQDTELFLQRVAKVQWGLMLSVYCVSHAPAIATLELPGYADRGPLLLLYFLLVLQMSDLFAVAASAFLGRTPLRFDYNKSREGLLVGALGATVLGVEMSGDAELKTRPAQLRMQAYATHGGVEQKRFELFALAASIVGKCHYCVQSHYALLKQQGVTVDQLRDVGRIAAVIAAAAQVLAVEQPVAA